MIIEQKIMKSGYRLNKVTFKMREGDAAKNSHECAIGGKWVDKTTDDFFKGKRVVLFSLPGAFTPTCSSQQLPVDQELIEKSSEPLLTNKN